MRLLPLWITDFKEGGSVFQSAGIDLQPEPAIGKGDRKFFGTGTVEMERPAFRRRFPAVFKCQVEAGRFDQRGMIA